MYIVGDVIRCISKLFRCTTDTHIFIIRDNTVCIISTITLLSVHLVHVLLYR